MRYLLKTLPFMALMALGGTALAQSSDTTEGETDPPAPVTEETAEVGQFYEKSEHGDWRVRCIRAQLGKEDLCEMYVVVVTPDKQPVSEFTLTRISDQKEAVALATVRTPLEVLLPPGIEIQIDGKPAGRIPYIACTPRYCQSEIRLRAKDVSAFKRGAKATLKVVVLSEPPQPIDLNVSLSGFTAAFDSLPEATVAPAESEE